MSSPGRKSVLSSPRKSMAFLTGAAAADPANQRGLVDLKSKFNGRTPVRIHFLDNSAKVFLIDDETTVEDMLVMVTKKMLLTHTDKFMYYGLYECPDGNAISDDALTRETLVVDVLEKWSKNLKDKTAKFLFMIRMYMPSITGLQHRIIIAQRHGKSSSHLIDQETYIRDAELVDSASLHLQYIQAVYNIITGRYPTTKEEALTLGAIHFLFKFGRLNVIKHQPGFLGARIVELIPIKLLRSSTMAHSMEEWENLLLQRVVR